MKENEEYDYCPNCKSRLKTGILGNNFLIQEEITAYINSFTDKNEAAYCNNCVYENRARAKANYLSMKKELTSAFYQYLNEIPVLTVESPPKWDYKIIGLVSTTFLVSSEIINREAGEKKCIRVIREKTFNLGGNAIIGTSIKYSMGQQAGYSTSLIISVYGTAIIVNNKEVFSDSYHSMVENYSKYNDLRRLLKKYKSPDFLI